MRRVVARGGPLSALVCLLLAACSPGLSSEEQPTPEMVGREKASEEKASEEKTGEAKTGAPTGPHRLTASDTTVVQEVPRALEAAEGVEFVQFQVEAVDNPERQALIFEVFHRPPSDVEGAGTEAELLGTFSLFPPDNPGRFIVATKGRLEPGGQIELSMTSPEDLEGARVSVVVAAFELLREAED